MSLHINPQFKYMVFHIFICIILLHLRVYYELTIWPAPSWLDSSVGRALLRYRRGHGFESRSSLSFFFFSGFKIHSCLSCVHNCDDQLMSLHITPQFKYMVFHIFICIILLHLRVYYELTIWPAPSWLDSSVGRALLRYRRGHGFESRSGLSFFQALISQLLKLCT